MQVVKNKRDSQKATLCLEAIRNKSTSGENLMPAVVEAVENYCTLGEISNVLREVFGEHK